MRCQNEDKVHKAQLVPNKEEVKRVQIGVQARASKSNCSGAAEELGDKVQKPVTNGRGMAENSEQSR